MADLDAERVVLCIEDVESSAQLVDRALRRVPGVRVVMARNGQEARQVVATTDCAVVLTDLNLPDVSGAEWVAELVRAVGPAGTPVVVVSADATSARKDAVLAVGATGYLTKPIDLRQLISLVSELAGRAPAPAEPSDEGPPPALVERYVAEATADLSRLRDVVASGDRASVEALSHRLKGGSVVFGAADLAALLDRLEAMASADRLDGAEGVLDDADLALAAFRRRGGA